MRNTFAALHPAAMAVAGGVGALVLALFGGFGMMGGWMMGGGGWMMGRYGAPGYGGYPGYHLGFGGGILMLLWVFVAGALAGWIVAVVYDAVMSAQTRNRERPTASGAGTEVAPR